MKARKAILSVLVTAVFVAFIMLGNYLYDNREKSYEEVFGEPYPESVYESEYLTPENGFISNEVIAVEVATAYIAGHLGKDAVRSQLPFSAELKDSVWTVTGNTEPSLFELQKTGGRTRLELDKMTGSVIKFIPVE